MRGSVGVSRKGLTPNPTPHSRHKQTVLKGASAPSLIETEAQPPTPTPRCQICLSSFLGARTRPPPEPNPEPPSGGVRRPLPASPVSDPTLRRPAPGSRLLLVANVFKSISWHFWLLVKKLERNPCCGFP